MNTTDIKDKVLGQIHAGTVHMRPRMFFVARIGALIGIAVVAFLVAVFFASFIIFTLQESGDASLLTFGPRGFATFLSQVPWFVLGVVLALVVLLEFLLRSFKFGYRIPILRVFAGVAGFSLIASVLIAITPFHSQLLERADNEALSYFGSLYRSTHASRQNVGVFRGVVTSATSSSFTISHDDNDKDRDDGDWTVISPTGASQNKAPKIGEKVYIAGDAADGVIHAYGIHKLPSRAKKFSPSKKQPGKSEVE